MEKINNAPLHPQVEINHFYISNVGDAQAKTAFVISNNETISMYEFEFRVGILTKDVPSNKNFKIKLDMGDGNYFADYAIEPRELILNNGWSGTEFIVRNAITNISAGQSGEYFAHLFLDDTEVASASTKLFIIGD